MLLAAAALTGVFIAYCYNRRTVTLELLLSPGSKTTPASASLSTNASGALLLKGLDKIERMIQQDPRPFSRH